ncbi:MAG: tyrosine-type recombinase/integrase, partial [Acidobacteriota bacterium]|nr:tyrosine-type recombinase/integrase [Acidobacteriota bacterium]
MPLFRKPRSPFWWYTITFNGKRYRASTGETTKAKAGTVMANALAALARGEQSITQVPRGATLRTLSERFLEWVRRSNQLKDSTRKYYQYGWRLLSYTELADLRVDAIRRDDVECTVFRRPVMDRRTGKETGTIVDCTPAYTNQALRTLKVILGKAEEWGVVARRPKFGTLAAPRRESLIDGETEATLQMAYSSPTKNARIHRSRQQAWLFLVILQDTGMRPDEVFPLRLEHIDWIRNRIFVPTGKTGNSRRHVGMSMRMRQMLESWCSGRTEGWVFPSAKSASGHLTTIAKGFQQARLKGNIDPKVVPYSARHTYGTFTMEETKNVFAVSKAMGHSDIKSMEPYQHPELDKLNEAVDRRNRNRDRKHSIQTDLEFVNSGHTFG